ncbi:hypothetical protein K9N50_00600 [bacterium]|nr:hypothetical protein [bacterium]
MLRKFFVSMIICYLSSLLVSCASSKLTLTDYRYPRHFGPVKVLETPPDSIRYREIGIVSSKSGSLYGQPLHDWSDLIEAMQKQSAKYGANALVITHSDKDLQGYMSSNSYGTYAGFGAQKGLTGYAIRILNPGDPIEPSPEFIGIGYKLSNLEMREKIDCWGLYIVYLLTLLGDASVGDDIFAGSLIPVIGPFTTIDQIGAQGYYEGQETDKKLMLASGIVQSAFFVDLIITHFRYKKIEHRFALSIQSKQIGRNTIPSFSLGLKL